MLTPWDMPPRDMPSVDPEPRDRWDDIETFLKRFDRLLIAVVIGLVLYVGAAFWLGRPV